MRNFKRVMALVITLVMLVPMCVVSNAAAGDPVGSNWTTFATKYYSGKMSTNLSKGFTFTEAENGGLHVSIPNGKTGEYGTRPMDKSAKMPVTKFTTTEKVPLDGLTATVELDDTFTFQSGVGSSVVMLWTDKLPASEETIFDTYEVTDPVTGEVKQEYVFGAANSHDVTYSNGFRAMVEQGTKGLMVLVNNSYPKYDKTQIASNVYVYYFDGEFVDPNDGYGYRWTFTARNYIEETQNGDYTGIVQRYEKIDCSNGITFSVNADAEHGYIVSVNGNEYYLGEKIAYFPNDTGSISREDELNLTEKYTTSMTYARDDIRMPNLVDIVDGGYLTVGSVGNNIATTEDSYTVRSINGIPAAQYNGEANTHECAGQLISSSWTACTDPSYETTKCDTCGAITVKKTEAAGHQLVDVSHVDPTCVADGSDVKECSVCGHVENKVLKALGHVWSAYTITAAPTATDEGSMTRTCATCGEVEVKAIAATSADFDAFWYVDGHNQFTADASWVEGTPVIYPTVKEDGSLSIYDYAKQSGTKNAQFALTKALSKYTTVLDGFTATVTPLSFTTVEEEKEVVDETTGETTTVVETVNYDVTPETMSFIWTDNPEDYDQAFGEYGIFRNYDGNWTPVIMRYGWHWNNDIKGGENSVIVTLMDYMVSDQNYVYGTKDDNVYDVAVYSIISDGNFWASKYITGVNIPMDGTPINVSLEYGEDGILVANFNDTMVAMPEGLNSQTYVDEYHFGVAAYTDGAMFLGGSSFEINTVCGEPAANWDGYAGEVEEEPVVPTEPELTTDNYTVNITFGDKIDVIRYAPGVHETASAIKNAAGKVDISAKIVNSSVVDDVFSYEMPNGGTYSFWVRLDADENGVKKEYIFVADMSYMEQEVSTYGVTLTVENLYGVKDFFIAPGHLTTYAQVKPVYVVNVTSAKIGANHNYSYVLSNPGDYTVWVRYQDASRPATYIHTTLEVVDPVFTPNGLQMKISNLEDVKVIRTAEGTYKTAGEIKKAAGARGFSGKTMGDSYMIQYRNPVTITIAVVYNHGYTVIKTYDVYYNTDAANVVAEGNTVTLTGLDNLQVARYAPGTYKTATGIKGAAGVQVIRATDPVDGVKVVEGLAAGTWTFYVQMNDESKAFFYVTVE
ncbi:MAG: hypothetical protein E7652_03965 [Ruminococcaceae bacterium]|nr:hypothetical protein [Oscillospiraceae bacterium]